MEQSANTVPQIYNNSGRLKEEEILKFVFYILANEELVFTQILSFL
jgi:hypothetical protein